MIKQYSFMVKFCNSHSSIEHVSASHCKYIILQLLLNLVNFKNPNVESDFLD